jgi:hypothetical protein
MRPKKPTSKSRSTPKKRALPATKPTALSAPRSDDALVAEAERRGREVFSEGERLVHEYGAWIFANFFAGETAPVLDRRDVPEDQLSAKERAYRARWRALTALCGSARLPLSQATVSNTVRVAAWDKRLADGSWSALSYSSKVALLPLNEPKAMRAAARHVLAASLDARGASEYVDGILHPGGKRLRMTPEAASKQVFQLAANVEDDSRFGKLETQLAKLDDDAKAAVADKLEFTIERLQKLLTTLAKP